MTTAAERALSALVLAAALAGCARPAPPAAAPSASPPASPAAATASPAPARTAAPRATPVPVHVQGAGSPNEPTILTQTVAGRRVYTIRALAFHGDVGGGRSGAATLEQPHVTFVDKAGKTTIADAPKATVTQQDKSVVMTGGVHARTSDGSTLTCDTLRYDGRTERFHGMGHVRLTGPSGLVLGGNYLEADVRLHDVAVTTAPPR